MKRNVEYNQTGENVFDVSLTKQHFSTKIFNVYLKYIEKHHPNVDVAKMCENSGLPYEYVIDENNWVSVIFARKFNVECIKETRDEKFPFKTGKMSLTQEGAGNLLYYILKYTLSTTQIYKTISSQIVNFTKVLNMKIIESSDNFIYIKYYPINLSTLNNQEKEALIANLDNIYQNAMAYIKTVPVIHGNPEAEIEHYTEPSEDGIHEMHMKIKYSDRKSLGRSISILLPFVVLIAAFGVLWKIPPAQLLLPTSTIKSILLLGLTIIGLNIILFFNYLKQRKAPIEAQNTIKKMDAQYRDLQGAKEKIEEMNVSLQKADKLKDDFLSNTSHELRTPLNGIIGIAESLIDGATGKLSPATHNNLVMITQSGKRLSHLVNDILDFSKLKNKDLRLQRKPVDIRQLTEVVLTLSKPLASDKEIVLKNNIPKDVPFVDGDESRLQQILYNLLGNAIKFTEKGIVSVNARAQDRMLKISVSDTGIGIPKEKHEDVFKSFEQADGSIEREYGGTGIGLSITKKLVAIHGGDIWVDSETGKGSSFFFTIPVAEKTMKNNPSIDERLNTLRIDETLLEVNIESDENIHEDQRIFEEDRRGYDIGPPNGETDRRQGGKDRREPIIVDDLQDIKILAVDDEPVNLQVIKNNFKIVGVHVDIAHSGVEAMDKLRHFDPDLVLLDIMMPKMNGYETAKNIRKHYPKEDLPIILLTAKNQVMDLVDGFSSGCNDYITKPLSKNELLARTKFHVGLARSRKELEKAEEKYRSILRSIEEGYFEVDMAGEFTFFNNSLCEMLNCPKDQLVDMNYKKFMDRKTGMALYRVFNSVYTTQKPVKGYEFVIRTTDDRQLNVEVSISLVKDADGRPLGFRGIVRDIIDRKQKEKAEKDRKAAEAATQAKSEFLANMSHEIRTPMNAIIGFSKLAADSGMQEMQNDYLKKIQTSADSLLGIINDILDFSKVEAGKLSMEKTEFQLYEVLENLSDMFADQVAQKELEMIVSVDDNVPSALIGDPLRLGQILINLTGNAIKFTEEGEVIIHVSFLNHLDGRVELKFSVQDTGIGVTPEQKTRLFSSFSQADSSTTRNYGGTGLGLTISKRLVEMMNGEIDMVSEKGKGSTFFFSACFDRLKEAPLSELLLPHDLHGLKALVVNNNPVTLKYICAMLEGFGCKVSGVSSGKDTIDQLQQGQMQSQPFGLVIVDWQKTPGLDGLAISAEIKARSKFAHIPIMIMTYFRRKNDMEKAAAAGADTIMNKPVTKRLLFEKIMAVFGKELTRAPEKIEKDKKTLPGKQTFSGKRMLLVEDKALNQQVASEILGNAGIHVEIANNGKEAVEMIHHTDYDAVLMDLQMPVMDGYEATRLIRSDMRYEKLPIIAMTAHSMATDREKCSEAGLNGHILKPIEPESLFATLARCMGIDPDDNLLESQVKADDTDNELPDQLPGINVETGLKRVNGNKKLFQNLINEFSRDYVGIAQDIKAAQSSGDTQRSLELTHTVKGIVGNISANDLHAAACELEKGIKQEKFDKLDVLMGDFEHALDQVLASAKIVNQAFEKKIPDNKEAVSRPVPDEVKPLLIELNTLLAGKNYKAMEQLEAVKSHLTGTQVEKKFGELNAQINRFDFQDAQQTLAKIITDLRISTEDTGG